jgi:hypothetical protein
MDVVVFLYLWVCSLRVTEKILSPSFFLSLVITLFDNLYFLSLCQRFVVRVLHLHLVCD